MEIAFLLGMISLCLGVAVMIYLKVKSIISSICKRRKKSKQFKEESLTLDMEIDIIKEAKCLEYKKEEGPNPTTLDTPQAARIMHTIEEAEGKYNNTSIHMKEEDKGKEDKINTEEKKKRRYDEKENLVKRHYN